MLGDWQKDLEPPADISYVRLVDSTRLRSANQIFQRRRLCDLPGFTSASFPQSYNSSTGAYNLGIRGMSDYVTGANTVTQAPGWSLSRTVETTSTRCCWSGSVSVEPRLSPCSHDLPWEQ